MNYQPDISERTYLIECVNGHSRELCPTLLESLIEEGDHQCAECGETVNFTSGSIDLECHVCSDVMNVSSLEEAAHTLDSKCCACENRGFDAYTIHVPGSLQWWRAENDWHPLGKSSRPLERHGREDYWEGVIHFCEPDEFASIMREQRIRACPTGRFKKPAVCLTEATYGGWDELRENHGRFGYVFWKSDLIRIGGGPALYLSESHILAQSWCDQLKPFVNRLRIPSVSPGEKRNDFLWEREWRTAVDIDFTEIQPYAVVTDEFNLKTSGWKEIFRALRQYRELGDSEDHLDGGGV